MSLGCGEHSAYITSRGGSPVRHIIQEASLSYSRVLNQTSSGSCDIPTDAESWTTCCEVLMDTEPWRDELVIYRDKTLVWAGPITEVRVGAEGGSVSAIDLFGWMERRFNEIEQLFSGDAAEVLRVLVEQQIAKDPSINLDVKVSPTGFDQVVRRFDGKDYHRIADLIRELGRSRLDFTMIGRTLLAGNLDALMPAKKLVLHDEGVLSVDVLKSGTQLATDVIVFGQTLRNGARPVDGRATRAVAEFGLLQESFAELLIDDEESAQANAEARVRAMQPSPVQVNCTLDERAAMTMEDLIPGRLGVARIGSAAGCVKVNQEMRLQQVDVSADVSEGGSMEQVGVNWIPVGVTAGLEGD